MISLGTPFALIAGGVLACAVFVLHLLAPRPPDRAPLPTARFLREEARTTLRFRRRPTDIPVLAARMLLALLLGLLFAQPRWLPEQDAGVTRIVLLDRGAGMADAWGEALEAVRREGAEANTRVVTYASEGLPTVISRAGDADRVEAAELATLRPADEESSYLAALRALRVTLPDVSTEDVEAVLITRPRWSAWDNQLAGLREAAWPGALRVMSVEPPDQLNGDLVHTAASPSPMPSNPRVAAALAALGYAFGDTTTAGALRFVASDSDLDAALVQARAGDTVVVYGSGENEGAPSETAALWDDGAWPDSEAPSHIKVASHLLTVRQAESAPEFASGRAVSTGDSATLLPVVLDHGAPLAAARSTGAGCLVRFGAPIDAGSSDPAYPHLLRALADGCRSSSRPLHGSTPLDSTAGAVLEGEGPSRIAVASVGIGLGRSLTGWVLLLTLSAALLESWLVWRGGQRRAAGLQPGDKP